MHRIKRKAKRIVRRVGMVAEIIRHPDTPWYVRVAGFAVVAYAASPIDLIPDFIPILGYLDDLLLLPLGILLVIRLTPARIRRDAVRRAARARRDRGSGLRYLGAMAVLLLWGLLMYFVLRLVFREF